MFEFCTSYLRHSSYYTMRTYPKKTTDRQLNMLDYYRPLILEMVQGSLFHRWTVVDYCRLYFGIVCPHRTFCYTVQMGSKETIDLQQRKIVYYIVSFLERALDKVSLHWTVQGCYKFGFCTLHLLHKSGCTVQTHPMETTHHQLHMAVCCTHVTA